MIIDKILSKHNLKFDELNKSEQETLLTWVNQLQKQALSIPKIRNYISRMKFEVEKELTEVGHEKKKDLYLKARLKNYMLLEAMLSTPERAKEQLEAAVEGMTEQV